MAGVKEGMGTFGGFGGFGPGPDTAISRASRWANATHSFILKVIKIITPFQLINLELG
jgi:hypothetical protein